MLLYTFLPVGGDITHTGNLIPKQAQFYPENSWSLRSAAGSPPILERALPLLTCGGLQVLHQSVNEAAATPRAAASFQPRAAHHTTSGCHNGGLEWYLALSLGPNKFIPEIYDEAHLSVFFVLSDKDPHSEAHSQCLNTLHNLRP